MSETLDIRGTFEGLLSKVLGACKEVYGRRLVSLAVFGSVGRGTPRPDSDIDLLVVSEPLPRGRTARAREFDAVDRQVAGGLTAARNAGVHTRISAIVRTPAEVDLRTPLMLDLVDDARILIDHDGYLSGVLADLRQRLDELGARRIWRGSAWYWDLEPDYRRGDVFEL